ncbi:hypothetical protein ACFXTI_036422 [Malus domestica]
MVQCRFGYWTDRAILPNHDLLISVSSSPAAAPQSISSLRPYSRTDGGGSTIDPSFLFHKSSAPSFMDRLAGAGWGASVCAQFPNSKRKRKRKENKRRLLTDRF